MAQFPFTITATEESTKKPVSFVLITASEDQRENWVKSLKSSRALAEVGQLVLEDIIRSLLWDVASTALGSTDLRRRTPTINQSLAHSNGTTPLIGKNRSSTGGTLASLQAQSYVFFFLKTIK